MLADVVFFLHLYVWVGSYMFPLLSPSVLIHVLYSFMYPCAMFHWMTNSDTCALTLLERYLRGDPDDRNTWVGAFIKPIYNLSGDAFGMFIKVSHFFLWMWVQWNIVKKLIIP